MDKSENPLVSLSNAMTKAVEIAGTSTLLVDARRRLPASGVAYAKNFVLTAEHVLERDDDIRVVLPDGNTINAQVAGRDAGTDLALLSIDHQQLIPFSRMDTQAQVGQLVLALGRPSPEGIQASLGVVSAVGGPVRTRRGGLLEGFLRTDAIPYPGFSGGPLIDASGNILGINTSGLTPGTSITIPTNLAWNVANALAQHGTVRRGYLGIRSQPVTIPSNSRKMLGRDQDTGLLLVGIDESGPANQADLMVGDILVAISGNPITDADQLLSHLVGSLVGQEIPVEVLRGGQPLTINVWIAERKL